MFSFSSMPSQSTMPLWHLFFPLRTVRISFTVFWTLLPVASTSQTLPFCDCKASMRQVSRISAERFSFSLASE